MGAVVLGKTGVVEFLLKKSASVKVETKDGLTPLTQAAFNGSDEIVPLLLEYGADVNKARGDGQVIPPQNSAV
jgi:ankyrin repeat protein